MIIYQIYPRSFHSSRGSGQGDLRGITEKLPYLAQLGVDTLWISPFFKSPMKDFGYDVSDYTEIDPIFGSMADFDELLAQAEQLGLGIMIDMVLSHSSDQHPWFQESRSSRNNPKSNWYVWADGTREATPNNWMSLFGGSAWQWDETREQYYLHNFLTSQPDFNFHEPAVRAALLSACEFWLNKGVRGFRLDVCNFYYHSARLENNPTKSPVSSKTDGVHAGNPYNFQQHIYDKDRPENLSFLRDLRSLADRYPETTLMGEVVSDDSLGVMTQYISGGMPLHTAYNFSLFTESFDGKKLGQVLSEFEMRLPSGSPSWALGNHDVPRFISRFQANSHWPESAKCFLFFLFSLRGNVILYQGDELGLDETEIPLHQMKDPFGIAFYPEFKGRDGCRTPLPWSAQRPEHPTWLPISDSHLSRSVELQTGQTESVLEFTRQLIAWRKQNAWLNNSSLRIMHATQSVLVLAREDSAGKRFILAINGSCRTQELTLDPLGTLTLPAYGYQSWPRAF